MINTDRIYVAGHTGMVGSAVVRALQKDGFQNILTKTHKELSLCNRTKVRRFFNQNKIDHVFMCAGLVGGIVCNQEQRMRMLYENALMALHVIHAAQEHEVKRFVYLGSSCQYPSSSELPLKPESLLTGSFTKSNEGYGLAKSIGLKMCEYVAEDFAKGFFTAIPCNIYGPGDNFHPIYSHFVAGIMRKCHITKEANRDIAVVLGTGRPLRELLFVDDLADALLIAMNYYHESGPINIGTGISLSLYQIANLIRATVRGPSEVAFDGDVSVEGIFDKTMNVDVIKSLGWEPKTRLLDGLRQTYQWALDNKVFP